MAAVTAYGSINRIPSWDQGTHVGSASDITILGELPDAPADNGTMEHRSVSTLTEPARAIQLNQPDSQHSYQKVRTGCFILSIASLAATIYFLVHTSSPSAPLLNTTLAPSAKGVTPISASGWMGIIGLNVTACFCMMAGACGTGNRERDSSDVYFTT